MLQAKEGMEKLTNEEFIVKLITFDLDGTIGEMPNIRESAVRKIFYPEIDIKA